ncbi:uncharacterized protein cubi_00729 [Cryptosporidium ubiquitum]|uniref:Uncharacterized protein n=1 Tax=Cryptosporidium ubiquitum TaxID=857276 RepID=A0A1J4MCG4_9CRYT|nr:uncharacterized protein cubi_00729 [Cryptosporidium ubiquitum]OII71921.1 hypothetical protein cubi_00729 [Cryptosporidium ubiquitum]
MYLEKEDLHLLNGSFFRVNFKAIPQGDLKNILKACGLKSSTSTSSNQQIALLEGIRRYVLTGDLSEISDLSRPNVKSIESKRYTFDYKNIINEETISLELILKSLKKSPLTLEKIMLSNSVSVSEIADCCSKYLNTPKSIFSTKVILDKIQTVLASLSIEKIVI